MSDSQTSVTPAAPKQWSSYMLEIYLGRKGPVPLGTVKLDEIVEKAREVTKDRPESFDFVQDSSGQNKTTEANLEAFEQYRIIPRMLVDATIRSIEVISTLYIDISTFERIDQVPRRQTTIFGVKLPSPLLIAPIGVHGIHHPDAELATAKAAGKLRVPFIMSTASSRSIEEVAQANGDGNPRWFQLYRPTKDDVTLSLLKRAKESGFSAIVITIDAVLLGWRTKALETGYSPYKHGVGVQVGRSDPVFMAAHGKQPVHERPDFPYDPVALDKALEEGDAELAERVQQGVEWAREYSTGTFRTWEDIKFVRNNWDGPLLLKGIQAVQDAEMAMEYCDGIIVSNHGGRQIDGAIASLEALNSITSSKRIQEAQNSGQFTVLFDSGIRSGSDIIKATALGAQGVLLGRPWVYGLIAGGEEGVEQVIKQTLAELHLTMGLSGWKDINDIWGKRDEVVVKLDV
ncbi:hypothetical protein ONZ45_g18514 [Pleurotus djamor]|nr:hypothetical protein ONZ45_g18514 [Pleurotus djamor]